MLLDKLPAKRTHRESSFSCVRLCFKSELWFSMYEMLEYGAACGKAAPQGASGAVWQKRGTKTQFGCNQLWVFFCIIGLGWISVGVEAIFKKPNLLKKLHSVKIK